MATGAFWAFGSALQMGDAGTPEAFATIAEIIKLVPPKMKRDAMEVTNHQTGSGWREYIAGFRDGGEMEVEANWVPSNATHNSTTGIIHVFANVNTNRNFKLVLPDGLGTLSFAGHINGLEPDLDLEKQGMLKFTLKVSGPVGFDF